MKKVRFYMENHKSGASKILAFMSVFFWGISFLFTKMGFKYYKDPVTLAVLRYVFSFFTIKEIDPAKVTEVNWSRGKDSIFVQLKAPQRITLGLPRGGFSYFLQIIEQNSKLKL